MRQELSLSLVEQMRYGTARFCHSLLFQDAGICKDPSGCPWLEAKICRGLVLTEDPVLVLDHIGTFL